MNVVEDIRLGLETLLWDEERHRVTVFDLPLSVVKISWRVSNDR